ncbi:enoyl-CoA hydratase/isomerase family protein [Limnohabitans planktonicus]|uniref:Enoyl-CoA hydratase n=1 Tax=Limnohabitans planktonicus II-D5 TaxID=1293045 RepID=A0A2T7U9K6_9BURK|nr:enoyl-CoA hydratase/isomerase family protein [Limnohabitans planktonicus]PVE41329.1 hypothetical protein H663_017770 [Limnohabitans planktonicus II-D5]|eukprot:gene34768-42884_t
MNYEHLRVQRAHHIYWVTLHRPETHNALSTEMVAELAHVVIRAALDSALRAVVLRGSAGFFSAGFFTADGHVGNFHSRLQAIDHAEGDPAVHRNLAFGHLLQAITALPMPVLAVVEGAAMGGGLGLACCADIVLATEDARFALSETGLGLIPAQIAPFVQARVGHREALRLGLSGERVSGTLAQSLGLVDALAADSEALDALQAQWLSRILAYRPQANHSLKAQLSQDVAGAPSLGPQRVDAPQRFAQCMHREGAKGLPALRVRRAPSGSFTLQGADVARLHDLGCDRMPHICH